MSVVDWAAKPTPWSKIGPQFREQCKAIAAGRIPPAIQPVREGTELRERRVQLGLTQEEIAEIAGFSKATVWNVEHDQACASSVSLMRKAIERVESQRLTKEPSFR